MRKSLFKLLEKEYGSKWPWPKGGEFYDPFKNLVITILSQNTSDVNSIKAYKSLAKRFKITPMTLAHANVRKIKNAIKVGGLYNIKARRIKTLAKISLDEFDGNMGRLLDLPKKEARKRLLEMPGIGNKTADVFLAVCGKENVIPIDTHLNLIAKRLGIVEPNAKYDEIQKAFNRLIPPKRRMRGHVMLIMLGKDYCKARNPRCLECPLKGICAYAKSRGKIQK